MLYGKNKIKFGQKFFAPPKICTPIHLCNPHIRTLLGIYTILLSIMPIEETGETRVRTDCLNFDVSCAYKLKSKFQLEEEGIAIIFFVGF